MQTDRRAPFYNRGPDEQNLSQLMPSLVNPSSSLYLKKTYIVSTFWTLLSNLEIKKITLSRNIFWRL